MNLYVMGGLWLLHAGLEYWLGKTDKVAAGSVLEFAYLLVKNLKR